MHRAVLVVALLLTGCTAYTPRYSGTQWMYNAFPNCAPYSRSAQAYYPPNYPCGSLSLELIKDSGGVRMYVNLLLLPVCPEEPYSDCVTFNYTIDGILYLGKATVLEGGQRLLVDELSMNQLIDAFLAEETVHINAGIHSCEVSPIRFGHSYEALMRFPM